MSHHLGSINIFFSELGLGAKFHKSHHCYCHFQAILKVEKKRVFRSYITPLVMTEENVRNYCWLWGHTILKLLEETEGEQEPKSKTFLQKQSPFPLSISILSMYLVIPGFILRTSCMQIQDVTSDMIVIWGFVCLTCIAVLGFVRMFQCVKVKPKV